MKTFKDVLLYLCYYNFFNFLDDRTYLRFKYRLIMNKKLDLNNPVTFNEKLQWLKLYDRKDVYTKMVDKYEAKKYVGNLIGKEYIIPTLGVYDCFDDIDFDKLPDRFVIKCTHDSGGLVIVKDKNNFDKKMARKKINKSLKKNYFYCGREWPYKNVKPRIIVDKYMATLDSELIDYKFFCFGGDPKIVLVCSNRQVELNENWYDNKFKKLDLIEGNHPFNKLIKKPKTYDLMCDFAKKLSKNNAFLRVDFYEINGNLYFGELTFYPNSGYEKFEPDIWDKKFGDMIDLSMVNNNEK